MAEEENQSTVRYSPMRTSNQAYCTRDLLRMVGALSVVVDSHSCPCLCLDALTSSNRSQNLKGSRFSVSKKLDLSTSFLGAKLYSKALLKNKAKKNQLHRKKKSFLIVSELAGQYEDSFEDVKAQLLNYFTYKAVRTVMNQLYEMNPTSYRWLYDFVTTNSPTDGKRFLRALGKEKHDLAERVMVTRLHLYSKWIKKCDHAAIYKEISEQNLMLMRERLMETVIWPSDDTNSEKIG